MFHTESCVCAVGAITESSVISRDITSTLPYNSDLLVSSGRTDVNTDPAPFLFFSLFLVSILFCEKVKMLYMSCKVYV